MARRDSRETGESYGYKDYQGNRSNGEVRGYRDYQGNRDRREVKEADNKPGKKVNRKRFVRYKEGAEMYSMCQSKFEDLARDAEAIYKVNKLVLVNCDIFEEYLETFRLRNE